MQKQIGNRLDAMNTRPEEIEEQSDSEDRIMENNEAEQKTERIMEHESRLKELSDSIKCNNICIVGIPEEEEEDKREQKIYLRK